MAQSLEVITDREVFLQTVRGIAEWDDNNRMNTGEALRLCKLGGGVLQFASTIFREIDLPLVYGQLCEREPEGRGAHFDLYQDLVHDKYPYIGVFNLSGEATITAARLPDDLAKAYSGRYPEPNDAAVQARRDFSSIALNDPTTSVYEGRLEAGSGMVIAQRKDQAHIIHDIVPVDTDNPGKFIKFAYLNDSTKTIQTTSVAGMKPLDKVLTDSLSGTPRESSEHHIVPQIPTSIPDRLISTTRPGDERPAILSAQRSD
jgi:hypothetical protein